MTIQKNTHIINCNIVDVKNKGFFPRGTSVILSHGKIEKISINPELKINSKILDLNGKYLIPSLINAHCHIQLSMPSMVSSLGDIFSMHRLKSEQIEYTLNRCIQKGITLLRDGATENLRDNEMYLQKAQTPDVLQSVVVSMIGSSWSPKRKLSDRINHFIAGLSYLPYDNINSGIVAFETDVSERSLRKKVDHAILKRNAKTIKIYDQRASLITYKPGLPLLSQKNLNII